VGTLPDLTIVPGADGRGGGGVRWAVSVDVVVLGDGGNVDDAVALAAYVALRDARVPRTTVVDDDDQAPPTFDVDPDVDHALPLDRSRLCVASTAWVIAGKIVVDPTAEEEACADSAVTVRVGADGVVRGVFKREGGALGLATFSACVATAATVARQFMEAAEAELAGAHPHGAPPAAASAELIRSRDAAGRGEDGAADDDELDDFKPDEPYGGGGFVRVGTRVMLSRRQQPA